MFDDEDIWNTEINLENKKSISFKDGWLIGGMSGGLLV